METRKDMKQLIGLIHDRREELGLSKRKLGEIAGLHHSYIAKLELGTYESVSAETLMTLAEALEVQPADLFSLAGYRLPESLPSFGPYLRTRYGEELSKEDRSALTHLFEALTSSHDDPDHRTDDDSASTGGSR
jgi:transcriptional regulator with XRE-family HTH domain